MLSNCSKCYDVYEVDEEFGYGEALCIECAEGVWTWANIGRLLFPSPVKLMYISFMVFIIWTIIRAF